MASKFEEALWRFRCDLLKGYGVEAPVAEIRLKRELYSRVMVEIMSAPGIRFDVIDLAEPKVFDVTIMPEKR